MGGGYALALAAGHGYAASSTNYGGCPSNAGRALARACPVVGSYGGKDRSPMGASAAARLERALTTLGIDHDIKVYPGAGHGFINNHDPADATLLLTVSSKVSGTRYHQPSTLRRPPPHRRLPAPPPHDLTAKVHRPPPAATPSGVGPYRRPEHRATGG
jgi:carboxymethylenebutenolidase